MPIALVALNVILTMGVLAYAFGESKLDLADREYR